MTKYSSLLTPRMHTLRAYDGAGLKSGLLGPDIHFNCGRRERAN